MPYVFLSRCTKCLDDVQTKTQQRNFVCDSCLSGYLPPKVWTPSVEFKLQPKPQLPKKPAAIPAAPMIMQQPDLKKGPPKSKTLVITKDTKSFVKWLVKTRNSKKDYIFADYFQDLNGYSTFILEDAHLRPDWYLITREEEKAS